MEMNSPHLFLAMANATCCSPGVCTVQCSHGWTQAPSSGVLSLSTATLLYAGCHSPSIVAMQLANSASSRTRAITMLLQAYFKHSL